MKIDELAKKENTTIENILSIFEASGIELNDYWKKDINENELKLYYFYVNNFKNIDKIPKGFITSTTENLNGFNIIKYVGIVDGKTPEEIINNAREINANAIVGLTIIVLNDVHTVEHLVSKTSIQTSFEKKMYYGTAVVIEKN